MTEDSWGEDADPVEDMKAAIKILQRPPDYKLYAEIENAVKNLTEELIVEGYTLEEIVSLYVKYGVWPGC